MKIEKVENTRTIKRKAKNLIINPNNEELSDNKNNKPRKTTIIERIYSDKTIDEEPEPDPEPVLIEKLQSRREDHHGRYHYRSLFKICK